MRVNFQEIRKLIIDDNVNEALKAIVLVDNSEIRNRVLLLQNQYNNWQNEHHLGLKPPVEERNRIVYTTLSIVSGIEKTAAKGKKLKKIEALENSEEKISATLEELKALRENGTLDLFLIWLQKNHSVLFNEMKKQESSHGQAKTFNLELISLDVSDYPQILSKEISESELKGYVLEKSNQIPEFFTRWELYNQSRRAKASVLDNTIKVLYDEHKNLLKIAMGGLLGGVLSKGLDSLFNPSEDIIEDDEESDDFDFDDD